jgi:hypothetical protein
MRICKKCGEQREDVGRCSNCNREGKRKYRLENPEKIKVRRRKYRLENPEKEKKRIIKWRLENPEKVKEWQIRKYLKKQIGETPPPELVEIKLLINKTKQLCKTSKN